ncbi:MarR family winged helix-turn-helix transcriptional regulator [Geothrix fermentans]|jgi:DNA-binding MarR family transcriptional regulator|uniref:MarR family winged helix-turn-helix transcriptional regulator n=1 Tax=Geothrix fermentans TaxID=44676 RepID=UPI0004000819|nr:MarR family winged helix-turn-helix transcriptional regulator [Geothrix fermentans]
MQEHAADPLSDAGLGTLAAAVRRVLKQVIWARLTPYGLSPQQFWVILVLLEKGPSSLHPLAQQVWMDDPTASRVVKAMVGRGWLTTKPDPRHGRRILIDIAPSALPMARELQGLSTEIRAAMVAGLSAEQQEMMQGGLRTMIGNLEGMYLAAAQVSTRDKAPVP